MKEALVLLGRMERAVVRPPLVKLGAAEIERLRTAIAQARLATAEVRLTSLPEQPRSEEAEPSFAARGPANPFEEQARASPDRLPSRQESTQAKYAPQTRSFVGEMLC